MHKTTLFILLASTAAPVTAQTSSNTTTTATKTADTSNNNSTLLTTTFFNPIPALTPHASVIGTNATDPSQVTYLIHCPPGASSATPTITNPAHPAETDPFGLFVSGACAIPTDGMTLVAGPQHSVSLAYTRSGLTMDQACGFGTVTVAAAAAATVSVAPTDGPATCDNHMVDEAARVVFDQEAFLPQEHVATMWGRLVVTAGVEKLRAAATASATGGSASSPASSSPSAGAAAGRFDTVSAVAAFGVTGAFGVLVAALAL